MHKVGDEISVPVDGQQKNSTVTHVFIRHGQAHLPRIVEYHVDVPGHGNLMMRNDLEDCASVSLNSHNSDHTRS